MQARPGEGDQATGRWLDLSVTPTGVSGLRDDGTLVRWRARPESRLARPLRPAEASGEMLALASTTRRGGRPARVGRDRAPVVRGLPEAAESVVGQGSGDFVAGLTPDGDVAASQRRWQCAGPTRPGGTAIAGTGGRAGASRGDLPNGTRLAIGSGTGAVALVEVGQEGMRLADHRQLLTSGHRPRLSPDGDRLASADDAGAVRVTNLADTSAGPGAPVATPMASTR